MHAVLFVTNIHVINTCSYWLALGLAGFFQIYPWLLFLSSLFTYYYSDFQVPWEDLRYLFGEIMYGGHITDDWDRRLCRTYLEEYMKPEMVSSYLMIYFVWPASVIIYLKVLINVSLTVGLVLYFPCLYLQNISRKGVGALCTFLYVLG